MKCFESDDCDGEDLAERYTDEDGNCIYPYCVGDCLPEPGECDCKKGTHD